MERPLKKRGIKDAVDVAEKIRHMGISPDYLVSSPARRALDTAGIMAEEFGMNRQTISIAPSLYQGSPTDYINEITQLPDNIRTVCIFGHNPEISEFCSVLAQQEMYLHTATAVIFDIAVNWRELETAEQFLILNPDS